MFDSTKHAADYCIARYKFSNWISPAVKQIYKLMIDLLDLNNLAIYIKLHQVKS